MSSRFGGRIKAFAKVGPNGESLIEYSLNQALKATENGFSKIVFIVSESTKEAFKEAFGENYKGVPVEYCLQYFDKQQRDRPWGTGQAVSALRGFVEEGFVVCNSDDIYGENSFKILFGHLKNSNETGIVGYKLINNLSKKGTSNRGVIFFENDYVKKIKEVLDINPENLEEKGLNPDDLVSMNIFALNNDIIEKLNENFDKFKEQNKEDRRIEFFLPTELTSMIDKGEIKMKVYPASEETIGLTYPEDEEIVRDLLSNK